MIWIFEREGQQVRLEWVELAPNRHQLRFIDLEGVEHVEEFTNATDAETRQIDLAQALGVLGWKRKHGATLPSPG